MRQTKIEHKAKKKKKKEKEEEEGVEIMPRHCRSYRVEIPGPQWLHREIIVKAIQSTKYVRVGDLRTPEYCGMGQLCSVYSY